MSQDRTPTTPMTPRKIDTTPFHRLLAMAGPSAAPGIVLAFLDDLRSTEIGLGPAWDGPDCAALRLHSHVLIALAGTVGDTDLQAIAQRLNMFAHDRDKVEIDAIKGSTMRGIADLILTLTRLNLMEE